MENPFKNKPPETAPARKMLSPAEQRAERERLHIKAPRKATPADLDRLIKFRLAALEGKDRKNMTTSEREYKRIKNRTHEEWANIFADNEERFTILVENDSDIIGAGRAEIRERIWELYNLSVEEGFRRLGIGKQITATRLNEIRIRGGKEVKTHIREGNDPSLGNVGFFGFKRIDSLLGRLQEKLDMGFGEVRLADVNDPEVIRKISEVLDEK